MAYYSLSRSTVKNEIGKYPQCIGVPDEYTFEWYNEPNSMTKLTNMKFPKEAPDLIFQLDNEAKLTDVISYTNIHAIGLLLNEKLKDILEDFIIPEHKFYPATLFTQRQEHQYHWLHIVKNDFNGIDFEKSIFIETDLMNKKIKDLDINSFDDYNKCWDNRESKFHFITTEKLILQSNLQYLDLLLFPKIHSKLIGSERLIKKLKQENITGMSYEKTSFLF